MSQTEVGAAIEGFLALLEGELAPEEREARLRPALDRLALAYDAAREHEWVDSPDVERTEPGPLQEQIARLFPKLGHYNVFWDLEAVGTEQPGVGDAIDDIHDIASDLLEVKAIWSQVGPDPALWQFRFGFETHWGRHLRELQLYLHARAFYR